MKQFLFLFISVGSLVCVESVRADDSAYVAHEWGTFTSIQGADGVPIAWRAYESSDLPGFVCNWNKAGLKRIPAPNAFIGKSLQLALQRLETPVIYFYPDHDAPLHVDATIQFPLGLITEWYPQASRIGPCYSSNAAGFEENPACASDSRLVWNHVYVAASSKEKTPGEGILPTDKSGSHYFAARATDSGILRVSPGDGTNDVEREKFLFYRGVGNFSTPMKATVSTEGVVTLTNSGSQPLDHLFVLQLHDGRGQFASINRLDVRASEIVPGGRDSQAMNSSELKDEIGRCMAEALVSQGLYPREAEAMVNTWRDSWFAEDGLRVLYILPRAWTDGILQMTLEPQPRKLIRVMVGRAEIITKTVEVRLTENLTEGQRGNESARKQAIEQLRELGRFADAALQLSALQHVPSETTKFGYDLLQEATHPAAVTVGQFPAAISESH